MSDKIFMKEITLPIVETGENETYSFVQTDADLDTAGDAADAKKTGDEITSLKQDLRQEIDNTNDSLLNLNGIPVNVEYLDITDSTIQQAATVGLTLTRTGINKFKLNGTLTSNFNIPLDWGKTDIGGATTLYYLLKRSDHVDKQDNMWMQIGWFIADDVPYQPADKIETFNVITPYTYPATAVTTRNYLHMASGNSFNNVEFEIIVMRKAPAKTELLSKVDTMLLADTYQHIDLQWAAATGYWVKNKTFATYSGIYTETVDVTPGEKYLLSATSYYNMCVGVYYSGDTVSQESIVDILWYSDDTARNNVEITVPYNAEHLLLQQAYTQRAELKKIFENNVVKTSLSDKLIAYNGDSICESRYSGNAANGGGYPQLIADNVGCFFENRGLSGGILASAVPSGDAPGRFIVSDVENMTASADLICFEGGLNDFYRDVPLGSFTSDDYTGTLDTTTVCGALESIFRQALTKWVGKPICFVIIHRCSATLQPNSAGYTFAQMREKMIGICEKYAIPYYDAYTKSGLNAYNPEQNNAFLDAGSSGQPDGMHPNESAYKKFYVPQLISLFERIMPVS